MSRRRPRIGLLSHQLDGELTGVGRYMAQLTAELCTGDHPVDAVPLVVGPLGGPADAVDVRRRLPTDRAVRRALMLAERGGRLAGHRAAFLSLAGAAGTIAAHRLDLDAVHDLTGLGAFAAPMGRGRVLTVHDLISHLPDSSNDAVDDLLQRRWLPLAARRIQSIVAVSQTTADDVGRFLRVSPARIHVARHGVDPRFGVLDEAAIRPVRERHGLQPGYVLFIGSASPRKNLATLVSACRRRWGGGADTALVVAGPARPRAIPGVQGELATGRIRFLGFVPEADLPALYNDAAVLAFPSSYEGFGLPALEAMRCGTPVIAGRGGALPEVVGGAGVLIEPTDDVALAAALDALLTDEAARARLRERGREHAAAFTWARAAQETVAAYRAWAPAA